MPALHLVDRDPVVDADELIEGLVPPPRFNDVRFSTYRPAPDQPSQQAAVTALSAFAETIARPPKKGLFRRSGSTPAGGYYLDGGFGVGKTHLLASLWHAVPGPKAYGTFVEYTHLVGALGFAETVSRLSGHKLVAVDEFELDDPGDTMLMTRLLGQLCDAGVHLTATSNTLPDKLGEGRFAAEDFRREIHALASRFQTLRVDGPDYRHQGLAPAPPPLGDAELVAAAQAPGASLDSYADLTAKLETLHPSRYGQLVDGVSSVQLRDVQPLDNQSAALRWVVLIDRLYDRSIPVRASGVPLDEIFTPEMLAGGYRKKYKRATSRILALARDAVS
ncbi:cell division protein ZapE [Nakamurella multipartita]|uniref:AFG1-family ATPase n=1 Tax=Nakamurella multipartita (strain ATCC 700099 / DSM 44233 / CIP 104796 / JCM 9543 / NBRC 105858 / Y-104) TaxID=479431 RepID=C8XEW6_NAKMY|nr:cell division protein ZapE [Nakamurella multipartita]ACV79867.1 AFG1-family ATPase [Nakamurella multipartita DSM 44233]HOZ59122.1 cell division protein ZapE [Nakamurella multipartita]